MAPKQVSLLDYFVVLVKWRRLLIVNVLTVAILAVVISLLLPKWYKGTAVIAPPKGSAFDTQLTALLSNVPFGGMGLLGRSDETLTYLAILQSRAVMESVIRDFDLIEVYDVKDVERALKALAGNANFILGDEGQIVVEVLDRDPKRAAAMANAFVSKLDSVNTQLRVAKARNDRIFLEKRFEQNKRDLREAEQRLKEFQEKYGAVALTEQTTAAIEGAAELQAQIYATEIELAVRERYLTRGHGDVVQLKAKLEELKDKLAEMIHGGARRANANGNASDLSIFVPLDEAPEIGLEYARLLRDVTAQNKLYELLLQLYEQAKIQEAKDTPTIQILDYAVPPLRKAKPKRAIIVIIATLFSFTITTIFILVRDYLERLQGQGTEAARKMDWIRNELARSIPFRRTSKQNR